MEMRMLFFPQSHICVAGEIIVPDEMC